MLVDMNKEMGALEPTQTLWDVQEVFFFQAPGLPPMQNRHAQTKHMFHV